MKSLAEKLEQDEDLFVDRLSELAPLIERRVRIKVREVLWGDTTLKDAYDVLHSIYGRTVQDAEVRSERCHRYEGEAPCASCEEGG